MGGGEGGGGGDGTSTTQDYDRTPKQAREANNTNDDSAPTIVITPGRAVDGDETATADVGAAVLPLFSDSPEAAKLFGFSFRNGDNVYKGLTDIVQLLSHAQQSHDGYRWFVANVDCAPLTPTQIFCLRSQCLYYLCTAYQIALEKLGQDNNTWIGTCCGEATKMLYSLGFNSTVDKLRIGLWNQLFQCDNTFPHPNSYVANGMKPKPLILELFPKAESMISDFVLSHLDHFFVEMLHNEFITIIIPGLKKKADNESVPVDSEEYIITEPEKVGIKLFE